MTRDRVEDLLVQAKEHLDQGSRDEALECIRKAIVADPGEMVITEIILNMERSKTATPRKRESIAQPKVERNDSIDMDSKLEKAFRLSDEAYAAGNGAKALAYLKKASQLFPDEQEVEEKLSQLKTRIQAKNLIKIGLKKLEDGDLRKAVAASRKAFQLFPEIEGLSVLLSRIEKAEENNTEEIPDQEETHTLEDESEAPASEAMLWADRIRAAVKDEKFEEAGRMVTEAVRNHPNDPLLDSFHAKLKRLGFAD